MNTGYELISKELCKHGEKAVKGLEEKFFINWTVTPNISKKRKLKRHDLKWQKSSNAVNKVSTEFPLCLLTAVQCSASDYPGATTQSVWSL